jgi:hypothetical protein
MRYVCAAAARCVTDSTESCAVRARIAAWSTYDPPPPPPPPQPIPTFADPLSVSLSVSLSLCLSVSVSVSVSLSSLSLAAAAHPSPLLSADALPVLALACRLPSRAVCLHNCSGRGSCDTDGHCLCQAGYTGTACERVDTEHGGCPNHCCGNGRCRSHGGRPPRHLSSAVSEALGYRGGAPSRRCECDAGFAGEDCCMAAT